MVLDWPAVPGECRRCLQPAAPTPAPACPACPSVPSWCQGAGGCCLGRLGLVFYLPRCLL